MNRFLMGCCLVFFIIAGLVLSGCGTSEPAQGNGEGFAIYLTANKMFVDDLAIVSHIDIADEPIIALDDIVSYDWETHEIKLTELAFEKIGDLELVGSAFVVCVDRVSIYAGAFFAMHISRTYDGIVILCPLTEDESRTIQIQLGYPWTQHFSGEDPRSDPVILDALEKAGKLK